MSVRIRRAWTAARSCRPFGFVHAELGLSGVPP
jgi:hypothetical protein